MIGRLARINQVLHNLLKLYPEQFVIASTFGLSAVAMISYIIATRPIITYRPWYRGKLGNLKK